MTDSKQEYFAVLDVLNETARNGDTTNVLRLGNIAEQVFAQALSEGHLPDSSYIEGSGIPPQLQPDVAQDN